MKKRDSLRDRMKRNYEDVSKTRLLRRTPVIIRLDGKAFQHFTRDNNDLEYGKDCWKADDGMSAWANNGRDRVWTIIKVTR